jgi:hypothetical protein
MVPQQAAIWSTKTGDVKLQACKDKNFLHFSMGNICALNGFYSALLFNSAPSSSFSSSLYLVVEHAFVSIGPELLAGSSLGYKANIHQEW